MNKTYSLYHLTEQEVLALEPVATHEDTINLISILKKKQEIANGSNDIHCQMCALIISKAVKSGKLDYCYRAQRSICSCCRKSAGFFKAARSGYQGRGWEKKYYNKGDDLKHKPKYFRNSINGEVLCGDCFAKIDILLKEYFLSETNRTAPVVINKLKIDDWGIDYPIYQIYYSVKCLKCDWTGWERDLGVLPAIIQGYYRGRCPACRSEETFLVSVFERDRKKWQIMEAEVLQNGQMV